MTSFGGLAAIHQHGLHHGRNLLVQDESVAIDVKISELGICGAVDKPATEFHDILPYAAPEVLRGERQVIICETKKLLIIFLYTSYDYQLCT